MRIELILTVILTSLLPYSSEQLNRPQGIIVYYDYNCEGVHSGNVSVVGYAYLNNDCSGFSRVDTGADFLIYNGTVHRYFRLAVSALNLGGAAQTINVINFLTTGTLQGTYLYIKIVFEPLARLKVCSSTLGQIYIRTRTATILMSDKLDPNTFISSQDSFGIFQKSSNTVCRGNGVVI